MSDTTKISFAHHTGSPWIGCTRVNTDCSNCYADNLDRKRFSKTMGGTKENPVRHWGPGAQRYRTKGFWRDAKRLNRDAEATGEQRRMFPSLCDWLDDEVPIEWFADFLKLIYETSNLTWMLFTKRPQNFEKRMSQALDYAKRIGDETLCHFIRCWDAVTPPLNVWIFGSAGCQETTNAIVPEMLKIPAVIHGVSCEPMTGPVDYSTFRYHDAAGNRWLGDYAGNKIDVVIFGGESDQEHPARPCDVEWISSGIRQCTASGVLVYVKQLGSMIYDIRSRSPVGLMRPPDGKGANMDDWLDDWKDLRIRELPKV